MTPDEQELFDELQREIEELRKLLGGKNKKVSDQVRFYDHVVLTDCKGPYTFFTVSYIFVWLMCLNT